MGRSNQSVDYCNHGSTVTGVTEGGHVGPETTSLLMLASEIALTFSFVLLIA